MSRLARMILTAAVVGCALPGHAAEPIDALNAQDRVQIRVLEWLPAKGEFREWDAVGGDYTVSPDLAVRIPFVGNVSARSRSLSDFSADVADGLQRMLSLPTRPEVRVEVLTRAPVYVLGGVETPGKIDFVPGLKAREAIALAGGYYRGTSGARLERDTINAESDLRQASEAAGRIEAKVIRLQAEADEAQAVEMPENFTRAALVEPFLAEQRNLFQVRREARESQVASLESRKRLAEDQLKAIDEQAVNLDRQIELTTEQLGNVQSLVDKGLSVATRAFDLERSLSELQGRRIEMQVGRLSTVLAINEAERDRNDLLVEFRTSVGNELEQARGQLSAQFVEVERAQGLLREATIITPEKLIDQAGNVSSRMRLTLTRTDADGETTTTPITPDETIQAGDTLQVQLEVMNPNTLARDFQVGQ